MRPFRIHSDARRIVLALVALALAGALGLSCGEDEQAVRVDLARREPLDISGPPAELTYAYLPQYSHAVSYRRHHLLVSRLQRDTDMSVRQLFPDSFDEHMDLVAQGGLDISYANPVMIVKMIDALGAQPFACAVEPWQSEDGQPVRKARFRGQIICRADSPIKSLEDVRGKTWIAVDPSSAGGYIFPLGHLVKHGIRPGDFREIAFAPGPGGKQEKVVLAVYAGKYDIGTIREGTLELLAGKIDLSEIRVLATTDWFPGWGFSARAGLPPDKLEAVRRSMLALDFGDPEDRVILERAGLTSIVPCDVGDFDSVRELMRHLDAVAEGR